jgi:hypothetical protein
MMKIIFFLTPHLKPLMLTIRKRGFLLKRRKFPRLSALRLNINIVDQ